MRRAIKILLTSPVRIRGEQCDQIGQNFAILTKCYKYLAIFLRLVSVGQHLGSTLAILMIRIGPIFTVVKAKY